MCSVMCVCVCVHLWLRIESIAVDSVYANLIQYIICPSLYDIPSICTYYCVLVMYFI